MMMCVCRGSSSKCLMSYIALELHGSGWYLGQASLDITVLLHNPQHAWWLVTRLVTPCHIQFIETCHLCFPQLTYLNFWALKLIIISKSIYIKCSLVKEHIILVENVESVQIACQMWASREIWIQLISHKSYEHDL